MVVMEDEEEEEEEENDDDDPDKKTYAVYLNHVAETPKHSIVCLICFLEKGKMKQIRKSSVEDHCRSLHNTPGIKCEKTGCMVRAKYRGDIGKHKKYCHDLKTGWWKKLRRHDGA
ncbi:uncharacterized protein [Triticum aestivum]|uniref:uncharacterized protein n=1 Tax=Triticum aestivum TaxID=4565 RepID=UPI001D00273F|nr:uncharacterized protein LOC123164121 [Triticum aestivum]